MSTVSPSSDGQSGSSSFLNRRGESQIERLRYRLDDIQERVGSDAALQRNVEAVLTRTLRQSTAGRPEEMAAILAPAVMTAIQDEIRYSPDAVANILQPLARPIAIGIIGSIIGEIARRTGFALHWLVSPWRWIRHGSVAAEAADGAERFMVRDCLLIHRTTGLLVAREPISASQGRTIDADFVASATSSIVSFVRRAYNEREIGGPSALSFADRNWLVRAGMDEILAFSYTGPEPTGLSRRFAKLALWLEGSWGREIRAAAGPLPVDRERALCRDLHSQLSAIDHQPSERPRRPTWRQRASRWALGALALCAIAAFGLWRYDVAQTSRIDSVLVSMVEGHPDLLGYPVSVQYDRATDHIQLRGLMPNRDAAESMVQSLTAATGYPVVRMFSILSKDGLGLNGRSTAAVMGDLDVNVRTLGDELSVLANSVAQSERANADWRRVQTDRLGRLAAQVAPPLSAEGQDTGNLLAGWGLANPISVDLARWEVDTGPLDELTTLADRMGEGQYIGLRPVSVDGPHDPGAIAQAVQLAREYLVANGVRDTLIVNRQPANGMVVEAQGDSGDGQHVSVRLEVVDLSKL